MLGSAFLYAGLVLGLVGVAGLVRPLPLLRLPTRRRAGAVLGLGALICAVAVALPAAERRIEVPASRLDEIVPVWQFDERHAVRIRASPGRVEQAVREVTAREIRLFLLLTWLRRPRLPESSGPEDILAPAPDRPILDVALSSGFVLLAEEPQQEIVFGTLVIEPHEPGGASASAATQPGVDRPAARFRDLTDPGYAKAVMNFALVDEGGGWTLLTTETRVFATDSASVRRFAVYWRLIYPGSSLIRRMWLAAIRVRAEAP